MSTYGTDFSGRSVIVTGGGSGIGRSTARRFAQLGARVLVADIDEQRARSVAEEIGACTGAGGAAGAGEAGASGGAALAVAGDLSEQAVVEDVVARAVEHLGGVDVLVNNAGIMDNMTAAADVEDAEWERVLRINLTAPFLLARAVLPHMLEAGGGAIVNTASEASLRGSAAGTPYPVSKHGVIGLTKSLAVMYRDHGVRTNAIAPGGTVTGIPVDAAEGTHGPGVVGAYSRNIGRPSDPDEQAAAIVFLASDAASNINGAVLPVDNGWAAV